jgi:hypothetical protein
MRTHTAFVLGKTLQDDEAFFIMGSSAIHVGALPYLRGKGLKTDTKSLPSSSRLRKNYCGTVEIKWSPHQRQQEIIIDATFGDERASLETLAQ